MPDQSCTLTPAEQQLIDEGSARVYRGRLIPIMRGGDETDEERATREAAEAAAAAEATKDKTFTQADVDRIVQERVARAKSTPPADYDELKDKAKRLEEIELANKTELEKAQERAEKAEKEREDALTEAKETRLRSSILSEAAKADRKVVDADAVLALLDRSTLTLDDNGVPTNIAEAMDKLLEDKPYLSGGGSTNTRTDGAADQGARGGEKQLASTAGMSQEEIAKAVADGRLNEYLKTTT